MKSFFAWLMCSYCWTTPILIRTRWSVSLPDLVIIILMSTFSKDSESVHDGFTTKNDNLQGMVNIGGSWLHLLHPVLGEMKHWLVFQPSKCCVFFCWAIPRMCLDGFKDLCDVHPETWGHDRIRGAYLFNQQLQYKVGSYGVITDAITPLYRGHDPSETHLFSAISRGPTLSHLSLVAHLINPNCRSTNPQIHKGSITTAREKCNCISANHGAGEGWRHLWRKYSTKNILRCCMRGIFTYISFECGHLLPNVGK